MTIFHWPCSLIQYWRLRKVSVRLLLRVVLLEGDDHHFFASGVAEHAELIQLDLHPFLAGIDLALGLTQSDRSCLSRETAA